jgi:hypothetical protein
MSLGTRIARAEASHLGGRDTCGGCDGHHYRTFAELALALHLEQRGQPMAPACGCSCCPNWDALAAEARRGA